MSLLSKTFPHFDEILRRIKRQDRAGFTMIELLVVIAVIGVLAVAVLSSLNPIEQINKGRDTGTRSDAAQMINAIDRYYAIHEVYPWNATNGSVYTPATSLEDAPQEAFVYDTTGITGTTNTVTTWDWAQILADTAEVKPSFTNRVADEDKLLLLKDNGYNETMYACFMPTSNAFQQEALENCEDGSTGPSYAGVSVCDLNGNGTYELDQDNFICLP